MSSQVELLVVEFIFGFLQLSFWLRVSRVLICVSWGLIARVLTKVPSGSVPPAGRSFKVHGPLRRMVLSFVLFLLVLIRSYSCRILHPASSSSLSCIHASVLLFRQPLSYISVYSLDRPSSPFYRHPHLQWHYSPPGKPIHLESPNVVNFNFNLTRSLCATPMPQQIMHILLIAMWSLSGACMTMWSLTVRGVGGWKTAIGHANTECKMKKNLMVRRFYVVDSSKCLILEFTNSWFDWCDIPLHNRITSSCNSQFNTSSAVTVAW